MTAVNAVAWKDRDSVREYMREYRQRPEVKEKHRRVSREWAAKDRRENPGGQAKRQQNWRARNPDKVAASEARSAPRAAKRRRDLRTAGVQVVSEQAVSRMREKAKSRWRFTAEVATKRGAPWSDQEAATLIAMHRTGFRRFEIALRLGRSEPAVAARVAALRREGVL